MATVGMVGAAGAQTPANPQPVVATGTPVDPATATRLVWWTMAAIDQANLTGNYSVLRDMGAPGFQANNSAATLAASFQYLRSQAVDLSDTLNVVPSFEFPPALTGGMVLRIRGVFPIRPTAIGFDFLFQFVNGRWVVFGVSVIPLVQAKRQGSTNH